MADDRPPRVLPRPIQPSESDRREIILPRAELFRDDLEDIVEILRRLGANAIEIEALGAVWDDLDSVLERGGQRVVHRLRIATMPPGFPPHLILDIWPGSSRLEWPAPTIAGYFQSETGANQVAEIVRRRRRTGLGAAWNKITGPHTTIRFTSWGSHQGFLAKNLHGILVLLGAVLGAIATALVTAFVSRPPAP